MISKKLKFAFSLIELLIVLIILSLVLSAFIPLITKKLKASDITVGSFGNNNTTVDGVRVKRDVTKQDCDKLNALYIPTEMNGGIRPVCATKWNMGDNGLPLSNNIDALDVGDTCTSNNCCFQGETSINCSTGRNGTYSGCKRTVCTWDAANNNCLSYAPNGTKKGDWRLPTKIEIDNWQINNLALNEGIGNNGLQLCTRDNLTNIDSCPNPNGCNNSSPLADTRFQTAKNSCVPYAVWTSTPGYTYAQNYYIFSLYDKDGNTTISRSKNFAFSNRCVLDSISEQVNGIECNCENGTCEDNIPFCTSCNEGYILENHKCVLDDGLEYREPNSQKDCDPFNALFIPAKYNGTGGKNLCVTKFNAGDANGASFTNYKSIYVDMVNVGDTCTSGRCCWKGKTSKTCDTDYVNSTIEYSSCNRTVCTMGAAWRMCHAWAPNGTRQGYWRIPTIKELKGWKNNLNILNSYQSTSGLQLCDANSSTNGSLKCSKNEEKCIGTNDNSCCAYHIWAFSTENIIGSDISTAYLDKGVLSDTSLAQHNQAFSARCVTDKILK